MLYNILHAITGVYTGWDGVHSSFLIYIVLGWPGEKTETKFAVGSAIDVI